MIVPAVCTGLLAGIAIFLDKYLIDGWQAALAVAGMGFAIAFLQDFKDNFGKSTASKGKKIKKKLRLLCFR